MGFLVPKVKQAKIDPIAAPGNDDRRVRQAGENAAARAAARMDGGDTIAAGSVRRRGGLGELMRQAIGG